MKVTKDCKINELKDLIIKLCDDYVPRLSMENSHNHQDCTCPYCVNLRLYEEIDAALNDEDEVVD